MEATHRAQRVTWRVVAVLVGALAYSWIASGSRPFTHPEAVAVGIPLVVAGIAALRVRVGAEGAAHRGGWVWGALFAALVAWELVSYRLSPRVDHPTLSSIADRALWAFIGWHLFVRGSGAFE